LQEMRCPASGASRRQSPRRKDLRTGRPLADFDTSLQRCSAVCALLTLMHRAAFVGPASVYKSKDQQPR
jgi:hypothetical protein